jgi:uncharacterized protein with ParB-like and HNH nuclease domain
MSNLLYTVEEIFGNNAESYLTKNKKDFYNIPVYQRGYKWKPEQVTKLLEDVSNFVPEDSKFYCLQNITLVPSKTASVFNVVDGQQRLTTLVLLLSYLNKKEIAKGKVRFPANSIRQETNKFLNDIISVDASNILNKEWDDFIEEFPDFDHQDIFYLFTAYQAIDIWFKKSRVDNEEFTKKLLNHVRLIANSISDDSKEEKIFGNLNSKRVPLDGSDLVRAILITRVAYEESRKTDTTKDIVRINERRVRIGWELDDINNWWSQAEVKSYFKRFVSIKSDEISDGNKLFKDDKYPINLLLLLFAEKKGESKLTLEFIEKNNNNALELYKEIIKLHSTLKDWYNDREIYHYLGFLFAQSQIKFKDVWNWWDTETNTREDFKRRLKTSIKKTAINEETTTSINSDTVNWYDEEQSSLVKILILLDVYWSTKSSQVFLPPSAFEKSGHDIEHIFPQNPKEIKDKRSYIKFLIDNNLAKENKKLMTEFESMADEPEFQKRVNEYIQKYVGEIKTNSIGNLVLLDASKNRSIGNNPYSVKRAALIDDINRGTYMRPHTLKVFVRYFDSGKNENTDHSHWTNTDILANAKAIENTLNVFFKN